MTAAVGTPAEQTIHRDPPPPPAPNVVLDEPATAQACQQDYTDARRGAR